MIYRPEGCLFRTPENQRYISSVDGLKEAMSRELVLEARVSVCSSSHDLIIELPCGDGIIPRDEGAIGISDGTTRDIALISRVNKYVSFKVKKLETDYQGRVSALLSRRAAQEECMKQYISNLAVGDIIEARVTHLEQFGCFVDIGCGIPSLIPIDAISVSRISHPSDRFAVGQMIRAVVRSVDCGRICLSHKELLGTWNENASLYNAGETVSGIVRSVEEYGIFVELAPNLAGLAEPKEGIISGQNVSVYIKAVIPEKMKIKLVIVDTGEEAPVPSGFRYFIERGHIEEWVYSTDGANKLIMSKFE